jgi:two-component sensor histidine kinase
VTVAWSIEAGDLSVLWTENGACSVEEPVSTGFGTKLVEITIERIGGEIAREWRAEGLRARISLPLSALRN